MRHATLLAAAAATLMAVSTAAVTTHAAPKEPVELASTYYLGGRGKLALRSHFSERPNLTWRMSLDGETFALVGVGDVALTGTFERKGGTGRKLLLTFDEESLPDLADALERVAFSLAYRGDAQLAITSVKAQVVVGKTPDKSKLKMKIGFEGTSEDESSTQRGSFKLNGKGVPRRVIVLDDDNSGPQVLEALRRAHIPAFNVGYYELWDGLDPPLDETDVVLFLQGYEYQDQMPAEADQALVDFVDAGGLLVRTEWCAYEYGDATGAFAIDAYLPVRAPESDYLEEETCTWTVLDRAHPLTRKLPAAFDVDGAGFSFIFAIEGATVLAKNQRDEPNLTIAAFGPGEVVHVNNDLTYALSEIPKEILQVLVNCAEYGLQR